MPPRGIVIDQTRIKDRVAKLLGPYWRSTRTYGGFSDTAYYLPTLQELRGYLALQSMQATPLPHLGQGADCDDHSFALKGKMCIHAMKRLKLKQSVCLGIAWGRFGWIAGDHACNWAVTSGGDFVWIEPQDNGLHRLQEARAGWLRLLIV